MVNKKRGEIAIKFGIKQYIMRATFQAICSIESEINTSIVDVLLQFGSSKPKLSEVQVMIYHGIKGSGDYSSKEEIATFIQEVGMINILPTILSFLELAVGIRR